MPKFAANLTMLFNEVPFLERFQAAAAAGFKGVEFLFPYAHSPAQVADRVAAAGVEVVLFNLGPGDWEAGDRGVAAIPGREHEFEVYLDRALEYARALGCRRLHAMSGIPPEDADPAACRASLVANVRLAAERLAGDGITLLLEPINRRDIPGYFLNRQRQAIDILNEAGAVNAALQMDLYHCQIVEGDLATHIRENFERIGHFQVAGVPERFEPDTGEVNYPYLFNLIDSLGYDGWIGCEYRPRNGTQAGLGWAGAYGVNGS